MRPVYVPIARPPRLISYPVRPPPFSDIQVSPAGHGMPPTGHVRTNQARNFPLRALLTIMQELPFSRAVAACREGAGAENSLAEENLARGDVGATAQNEEPVWDCAADTERQQDNADVEASMEELVTSSSGTHDARDCEICQVAYSSDDSCLVLPCE